MHGNVKNSDISCEISLFFHVNEINLIPIVDYIRIKWLRS